MFTGASDECIIDFFEYFNMVAKANDWLSNIKLTYLPLYLKNTAYRMYSMLIAENPNLTFEEIEDIFKTKFVSPARNRMLRNKLRNRKFKCNETIAEFLTDMLFLISQTNKGIPEVEKIDIILEALTPDYYNSVTLMKNDNLKELERNLRKIETSRSMSSNNQNVDLFELEKFKLENLNLKSKLNQSERRDNRGFNRNNYDGINNYQNNRNNYNRFVNYQNNRDYYRSNNERINNYQNNRNNYDRFDNYQNNSRNNNRNNNNERYNYKNNMNYSDNNNFGIDNNFNQNNRNFNTNNNDRFNSYQGNRDYDRNNGFTDNQTNRKSNNNFRKNQYNKKNIDHDYRTNENNEDSLQFNSRRPLNVPNQYEKDKDFKIQTQYNDNQKNY